MHCTRRDTNRATPAVKPSAVYWIQQYSETTGILFNDTINVNDVVEPQKTLKTP